MPVLDGAWALLDSWPVDHAAAVVVTTEGMHAHGDVLRRQRIASVSKPLVGYACLVATEEGSISLDDPVGQPGCTVRHLLAHAGGYPFEGGSPVGKPETRRIYSNTGFEMLAEHVERSSGIPFPDYLSQAVFEPLAMTHTSLEGSPAKDVWSTVDDLALFLGELRNPRLLARETFLDAVMPVFPALAGIVPGVGSFDPCPWGLGFEIRGDKSPHWTGSRNSRLTFGHFGGIGTFLWVDPVADVAVAMLAEREFDEWGLAHWPAFSDEVLTSLGRGL